MLWEELLMSKVAGIDWARREHMLCIVDERGRVVHLDRVTHSESGLREMTTLLASQQVQAVALERPDGLLIDRLLDSQMIVYAIHPNQVCAAKPRYNNTHAKTDELDAFVLASLALTDSHRLRALVPDSDLTRSLRVLTRQRQALITARLQSANQLQAQLEECFPAVIGMFKNITAKTSLALIERYFSGQFAELLSEEAMAQFLLAQRYRGPHCAKDMIAQLDGAPRTSQGIRQSQAQSLTVLAQVDTLRTINGHICQIEEAISTNLERHPDSEIFCSLFSGSRRSGIRSVLTPAILLCEIGDCRDRYPTEQTLAAAAGVSPIPRQSGQMRNAVFRRACNRRLRSALATLSDTSRRSNPWAQSIYAEARARGLRHPHAIRVLGRAWVRVIHKMWVTGTPYDPQRHGGYQRVIAAADKNA